MIGNNVPYFPINNKQLTMRNLRYSLEIHKFVKNRIMTTLQLKNALIQRISEIEDKSFLEAIKTILDAKSESKIINLTPELTDEIMASKKEIEQGLFIENDSLEKEIEEWLYEK